MKIDQSNFESNVLFLKKSNIIKHEHRILEIGSGAGHLLKYLLDNNYNVIGTEVDDQYIKFAKSKFSVEVMHMRGEELLFKEASFDVVLSFDVFEHIAQSDLHLQEVHRVLKNGGYYLFQTPNKWANIPFEIIKEKSFTKYKKWHVALHNYWELRKRLQKHRFEVSFLKVPVVNEFFLEKVKKYLGRIGLFFVNFLNFDNLPAFLRPNFYVIARKKLSENN